MACYANFDIAADCHFRLLPFNSYKLILISADLILYLCIETTVKKTRGPTQCLKIHARQLEDREQITLDSEGEAIGPTDEAVNNLSKFLGTVARNSDFCPLIYTNWKGIKDKEAIWEYVQAKFIIPTEGKRMVLAHINDNWRRLLLRKIMNHLLKQKCLLRLAKAQRENHWMKTLWMLFSGVDLDMLAAQLGSTLGNPNNNDAHEEENYVEGEIELD
ncbi:uncharacterized protein LOC127741521 [Arachis duranensis]|uniref:Uncharacterized protein LOC127741521 n=1 Tax=Arachis duranensis TaxID=130453 RepID=A0A9C6TAB6_ARADU|nr:uncharacterized protein LOC127741521 [Arachis duranensis]